MLFNVLVTTDHYTSKLDNVVQCRPIKKDVEFLELYSFSTYYGRIFQQMQDAAKIHEMHWWLGYS